jgi:hypothetical protein
MRAALAGALYFLVVFAAGFVLGILRVLVVAPRLGELAAVLVEVPLLLVASWLVCRAITRRLAIPHHRPDRLVMSVVAFCLLISIETVLGYYAFGRSLESQRALMATAAGAVGLGGQIVFALFPLLQSGRRNAA